eukprot:672256_1
MSDKQIRKSWRKGSRVEVYSRGREKWMKGVVARVFVDEEGEWLEIQYGQNNKMFEESPRDSTYIRPFRDSLATKDQSKRKTKKWDVGERIYDTKHRMADIKYYGECDDKGSGLWYGIEYVDGSLGKHNGIVNGEWYFDGKDDRCVMIRAEKIRRTAYTAPPKIHEYNKKAAEFRRKKRTAHQRKSSKIEEIQKRKQQRKDTLRRLAEEKDRKEMERKRLLHQKSRARITREPSEPSQLTYSQYVEKSLMRNAKDSKEVTKEVVKKYIADYVREARIRRFPKKATRIIAQYIKGLTDNTGVYQWKIDDASMVRKMLNAKPGEKFESEVFELAHLRCKLAVFPNGEDEDSKGYFRIILHILDLPDSVEEIVWNRSFRVKEVDAECCWLDTQSDKDEDSEICALSELVKLGCKTITIEAEVHILKMILKDVSYLSLLSECKLPATRTNLRKKCRMNFVLDVNQLAVFKNCLPFKKRMCIFNPGDKMWCLELISESGDENWIVAWISLCYIPPNVKSLDANFKMECDKAEKNGSIELRQTFTSGSDNCKSSGDLFRLSTIGVKDQVTFKVEMEIKDVEFADETGSCVVSDPSRVLYLLSGVTN